MGGVGPADEDRLPWLEPYREVMAQKRRVARRSHGGLAAIVIALILLPVALATGYWLGQQRGGEPLVTSRTQPSATVALSPAKPAPSQAAEATPGDAGPDTEPAAAESAPEQTVATAPPRPPAKAAQKRPARKPIRSAGTRKPRPDAVRAAREREALSRQWPKMPSPGPAGQVIQLGAFSTATRANSAYSARIARYPLLATMPKVVVPVVTKPDGRILYVLRLGTTSRQQSKAVCRNLQDSGDHCLVIG